VGHKLKVTLGAQARKPCANRVQTAVRLVRLVTDRARGDGDSPVTAPQRQGRLRNWGERGELRCLEQLDLARLSKSGVNDASYDASAHLRVVTAPRSCARFYTEAWWLAGWRRTPAVLGVRSCSPGDPRPTGEAASASLCPTGRLASPLHWVAYRRCGDVTAPAIWWPESACSGSCWWSFKGCATNGLRARPLSPEPWWGISCLNVREASPARQMVCACPQPSQYRKKLKRPGWVRREWRIRLRARETSAGAASQCEPKRALPTMCIVEGAGIVVAEWYGRAC